MSNLKCLVDQKEYRYCPVCEADRNKPTWYSMFCCENCKDIFTVLRDNSFGVISDEKAKEELNKLDLSEKDKMTEGVQNSIDKLLKIQAKGKIQNDVIESQLNIEVNEKQTNIKENVNESRNDTKGFLKKKK